MEAAIPPLAGTEIRRKRASKACLTCRARKVRCDVAHRGTPCLNCYLDKQKCIVKPRVKKYHANPSNSISDTASNVQQAEPSSAAQPRRKSQVSFSPKREDGSPVSLSYHADTNNPILDPTSQRDVDVSSSDNASDSSAEEPTNIREIFGAFPRIVPQDPPTGDFCDLPAPSSTHVTFSYYPFLELDSMSKVSPGDVNFLEAQGCFRVPTRPILDEFIREYFLHIQPLVPFLNERIFWKIYLEYEPRHFKSRISLFVFQTMLFTASSFVSKASIQKLGFKDNISARASYYRRAKMLFNFDAETDPISLAQGTLIMSYHSPMIPTRKSNIHWLNIACQFAKDAKVNQYATKRDLSPGARKLYKRLWWCCILRDRILPLGVRRPLTITSNDFDFTQSPLTIEDFEDEFNHSKVYDAPTKTALAQLITCLCELAVHLTEVITLLYPSSGFPEEKLRSTNSSLHDIVKCKNTLNAWFEKTTVECATPGTLGEVHESLPLYTNLMYIYYRDAMTALCHRQLYVYVTDAAAGGNLTNRIFQLKQELGDGLTGITENLKEIVRLNLARYMPISIVAYAALPLVIHLLDVKLSRTAFQTATRQRRVNIFTEVMRALKVQYEVTDSVSSVIGKMVEYITLEKEGEDLGDSPATASEPPETGSDSPVVSEWGDVFLRQPTLYLRLVTTIDLYLAAAGDFPEDREFPLALQARAKSGRQKDFPGFRINVSSGRRQSEASSNPSQPGQSLDPSLFSPSRSQGTQLPSLVEPDQMFQPAINLDGMNFNSPDFVLPMGFEAFDIEMFERRGMEFEYSNAWMETGDTPMQPPI